MLIDDYISYSKKYKEIYGEKIVILMQVGSFFEFYGIPDKNQGVNVDEICNILEIQSTRKNKSNTIIDKNNPKMAGIPLYVKRVNIPGKISNRYIICRMMTDPKVGLCHMDWLYGGQLPPAPPVLVARSDFIPFDSNDW